MDTTSSRRGFIRNTSLATLGASLISTSAIYALGENVDTGLSNIDLKPLDMRRSGIFGKHLKVTGILYGSDAKSVVPNSTIEVWHKTDNAFTPTSRTTITTNEKGQYSFLTDMPTRENGKAKRVYFKVKNGAKSYTTELIIHLTGADITSSHWEMSNKLGDKLFPSTEHFLNKTNVNFNLITN